MNRPHVPRLLLAGVLVVGLAIPLVWACAPAGPTLAFTWDNHPDLPLNAFAAGRLGVLQPTYARSYLIVAYRYLIGSPLSTEEQQGALALWEQRLGGGVKRPATKASRPSASLQEAPDWKSTRTKFTKEPAPEPARHKWVRNYYNVEVTPEAQEVAARTLLDRARRWAPGLVVDWIQAQDQVFSIDSKGGLLPKAAPPGADPLFTRDRAYQIASALFYRGDYPAARKAFQTISQDPASPWQRVASYLVGRCWMTEAQRASDSDKAAPLFVEAQRTFKSLEEKGLPAPGTGPAPEPVPEAALLEAIEYGAYKAHAMVDPSGTADALVSGLLGRAGHRDFGDLLGRFTFLLDANILGEADYGSDAKKPREIVEDLLRQDMTEWVFRFRETGPAAYRVAYDRWKSRGSLPWLLMALANGEPSSKGIQEVLDASARVAETQAGYEAVCFHRARVLIGMGREVAAKPLIATFTGDPGRRATPSSLNLWRALRMPLAQDGKAFLADALRIPVGSYGLGDLGPEETSPPGNAGLVTFNAGFQAADPDVQKLLKAVQAPHQFIQGDAARVLNTCVPTEVLIRLAREPGLPPHLRNEWNRASWVRAVLLERWDVAAKVTPEVIEREPDLRPILGDFIQAPEDEKAHLALLAVASHPGLRWMVFPGINRRTFTEPWARPLPLRYRGDYRGTNWWPPAPWTWRGREVQGLETWQWAQLFYYPDPNAMEVPLFSLVGPKGAEPGWLTAEERKRGEAEGKALMALPEAPDWITERVLAWAQKNPDDPRIPEALHHAVLAEKMGGGKRLGITCFKLLHSRYRSSPWARKTPIHY